MCVCCVLCFVLCVVNRHYLRHSQLKIYLFRERLGAHPPGQERHEPVATQEAALLHSLFEIKLKLTIFYVSLFFLSLKKNV